MNTRSCKAASLCAGVIEAGWLVALAVVPLFFNPFSNRSFEPDKIAVLRVIALVMVGAWLVALRVTPKKPDRSPGFDFGIVLPVAAIAASTILSCGLSVDPQLSTWGSYQRGQGAVTLLCYMAVFLLAAGHLRRAEQWNRVVFVVVITSVAVSLYALMQWVATDPMSWSNPASRSSSTLGNPIFLGGFLLMTIFITVRELVDCAGDLDRTSIGAADGSPSLVAAILRTGFFLFAVVCQVFAFVLAASRGPLIGMVAGAFVLLVLSALQLRARVTENSGDPAGSRSVSRWSWSVVLMGGVFVLAVLAGAMSLQGSGSAGSGSHRFSRTFDFESPTVRFRLSLWGAVLDMMNSPAPLEIRPGEADPRHSVRWLVGYGPETLRLSLNRFLPRELIRLERRGSAPDRAHNEALDQLADTGIVGLLAWLGLWGAVFLCCIRGLVGSMGGGRGALYWLVIGSSVSISVALAGALTQGWVLSGPAATAGLALGSAAFAAGALFFAGRRGDERVETGWRAKIAAVVMATLIAHLLELSFSFTTSATGLYFWFLAATAVAAAGIRMTDRDTDEESGDTRALPDGVILGLLTAVVCSTLLVNLGAGGGVPGSVSIPAGGLGRLAALIWVAGLVIASTSRQRLSAGSEPQQPRAPSRFRMSRPNTAREGLFYVGSSAFAMTVFAVVRHSWLGGSPSAAPSAALESVSWLGVRYAWAVLVCVFVIGVSMVLGRRRPESGQSLAVAAGALVIVILAVAIAVPWWFRSVRADVFAKYAGAALDSGAPMHAVSLASRAVALAPDEDAFLSLEARSAFDAAEADTDDVRAVEFFDRAEKSMMRAVEIRPLDPDHVANLARLRVRLSERFASDERRVWYQDRAVEGFERALELRPGSAEFLAGLGGLMVGRGELESAVVALAEAVRRDDRYIPAVLALARCHGALAERASAQGEFDLESRHLLEARGVLHRALESNPDSDRLLTALGELR